MGVFPTEGLCVTDISEWACVWSNFVLIVRCFSPLSVVFCTILQLGEGSHLCYVCLSVGSEASGEGVKAGERHSGGEGERHPAHSASAGLRQHREPPEQRWAHTGDLKHNHKEISVYINVIYVVFMLLKVFKRGVCQDLYQSCEKMRPTLFRLASDTEDNDEALGECLRSSVR